MALSLVKAGSESREEIILKGLNPRQIEAVRHIEGPLLIVAGAGSGKTRVLTHRIAYLIESGISPSNILALTFTNKAAKEMTERISRIVPPQSVSLVTAGTFHSIFARILRREAALLDYTPAFSIYDTEDTLALVKTVMGNLNISQQQTNPGAVRSAISWSKNQMIDFREYAASAENIFQRQCAKIFENYEKALHINNAMDFDDLLLNLIRLFKRKQEILDKYIDNFRFILVDEYQDTNKAQFEAIRMLASKYGNVCVVGDDAQSIYKWRGAEIKNILEFERNFGNSKVIRLEQNYRSTKIILGAAESVIKYNKAQLPKTLWTDNPDGELIDVLNCSDDREEAEKIASIIKEKSSGRDFEPQDFAVLYRTNAQSLALENSMRRQNLPYIIIGGMSFYKRKEIKDVFAYLKLLVNPRDSESLLRIINEPPRGIGHTSIGHISRFAEENSMSLFEALELIDSIAELKPHIRRSAAEFLSFVRSFIQLKETGLDAEIVKQYILNTGLLDMYKDMNTEESLDHWNNIRQLLGDISDYFLMAENPTLDDYLQQISLVSDIDTADTTKNSVKLMTLHSAKGLEFPVVFIAGLEQGLFPLAKSELLIEEEEEERRLFYVGITRAEQKLYLAYARRRNRFGEISSQKPSKFIHEINGKFIRKAWSGGNGSKPEFTESRYYQPEKTFSDDFSNSENYSQIPKEEFSHVNRAFNFKAGDKVRHNLFGKGKIEQISGFGTAKQATVIFETVGRKKLMLKYANLIRANDFY